MKLHGYSGIKAALRIFFVMLGILAFAISGASAAVKCGSVKNLTNSATAVRGGGEVPLERDAPVFEGDIIRTGEMGYVELKFIDDTLVAMGNNGVLALAEVQFNVDKSQFRMSIDHGVVWVSTGSIGLVNAEAVKFTTPNAVVSSGNATLQFVIGGGADEVEILWLNNGGRVAIYNIHSKARTEIKQSGVTIALSGANALSVISGDAEE